MSLATAMALYLYNQRILAEKTLKEASKDDISNVNRKCSCHTLILNLILTPNFFQTFQQTLVC